MDRDTETAELLAELRQSKVTIANIPLELRPPDEEAAYTVQDRLITQLLSRHGGRRIGYKVACTSQHAQRLLRVDGPFTGRLLSASTYDSPANLASSDFNLRVIEPEFGFEVAKTVAADEHPYDETSIVACLGDLIPAIEVVDHRFTDFTVVGAASLIADNAIHGACIFGDRVTDWRHIDLTAHAVQLQVNGSLYAEGSGANVLGGPLAVMAWLANHLLDRGNTLRAGDLVITGVATKTYRAELSDRCVADFGPFGAVAVIFN